MGAWWESLRRQTMDGMSSVDPVTALSAFVVLSILVVAVLVVGGHGRRLRSAAPASSLAVPSPMPPPLSVDEAARSAATVAALRGMPRVSSRSRRLEEQGGHLTRMVSALVRLGPTGDRALAALVQGETGPALTVLATTVQNQTQGRARSKDGGAGALCDLAVLALLDDPAAAVAAIRRATELAPNSFGIWHLLGLAAVEAGDWGQARAASESVLASGDSDKERLAGALGLLGESHLAEGRLDQAEACLRIALIHQAGLEAPGGRARYYQMLSDVYQKRGDGAGAAGVLSRALALGPDLGDRESMAELETAAGLLAHQRGGLPDACRHWARARELFQAVGRADRAAEIGQRMTAALRAPPSNPLESR